MCVCVFQNGSVYLPHPSPPPITPHSAWMHTATPFSLLSAPSATRHGDALPCRASVKRALTGTCTPRVLQHCHHRLCVLPPTSSHARSFTLCVCVQACHHALLQRLRGGGACSLRARRTAAGVLQDNGLCGQQHRLHRERKQCEHRHPLPRCGGGHRRGGAHALRDDARVRHGHDRHGVDRKWQAKSSERRCQRGVRRQWSCRTRSRRCFCTRLERTCTFTVDAPMHLAAHHHPQARG